MVTSRCGITAATIAVMLTYAATGTPLDDYVALDDGVLSYTNTGVKRQGDGWTGYIWNLTSLSWLTRADSNRNIWWHHLIVVIPHKLRSTKTHDALMYITGGDNNNPTDYPDDTDEDLVVTAALAVAAGVPAATLYQVPNQPIEFPVDPWHKRRSEDDAIALTWWRFVHNTSDPRWILEFPMTKAAVRALDALQQIIPQYTDSAVYSFLVAGASKRGWTTWLVGAVEAIAKKRVKAIMPLVLDALNLPAFAHRQWQFYGAWTFALQPYYDVNFTSYFDSPECALMCQYIDPYWYLPRLTMPKLVINAGGDEFQMPDDQRYWAPATVGETNFLMVKNAEHSLATGVLEVLNSAGAFAEAVIAGAPRPAYTWTIDNVTGRITVSTDTPPSSVTVAYSDSGLDVSKGRRDFRWAALNVSFCIAKVFGACVRPLLWTTTNATAIDSTTFTALLEPPQDGWRAFFIELQWPNHAGTNDFYFTTPASVVPNTYPFPDCHGAGCRGTLC